MKHRRSLLGARLRRAGCRGRASSQRRLAQGPRARRRSVRRRFDPRPASRASSPSGLPRGSVSRWSWRTRRVPPATWEPMRWPRRRRTARPSASASRGRWRSIRCCSRRCPTTRRATSSRSRSLRRSRRCWSSRASSLLSSAKDFFALLKKNTGKYSFSSMGAGIDLPSGDGGLGGAQRSRPRSCAVRRLGRRRHRRACPAKLTWRLLPAAAVMPHIKAGKIRGLAVASAKRSAFAARAADAC